MVLTSNPSLRVGLAVAMIVAVMMIASPVFAANDDKAADEKTNEKTAKSESIQAGAETVAADPFAVPDGTPEELFAFIQKVSTMHPERQDMASVIDFVKKSRTAIIEAADKVLNSPKVTEEQFAVAVRAKLKGLATLLRTQDPKAIEMLKAFPKQLEKLKKPEIAKEIQGQLLGMELAKAAYGAPDAMPLKEAVAQINTFVGDKPEMSSLRLIMRTASLLGQVDKKEAVSFCQRYGKLFAASKIPALAEQAKSLEGTARRLDLVGKPMTIVGKTLDGSEFDWASYKGKVVLVQFWATWCKPCREEISHLVADYEKYHKQGFDVVGISLDYNLIPLKDFLKGEPLPWTIVYNGPRDGSEERELPNVTHYGVNGIPELILVGRDGNVIGTGLRGPALALELETLFGSKEEEKLESN